VRNLQAAQRPLGAGAARRPARGHPDGESPATVIANALRGYAERGIFAAFAAGPVRGSRQIFNVRWHYRRQYRVIFDAANGRLAFSELLPAIPAKSAMAAELREFVHRFSTDAVPDHRRVDPDKGRVTLSVRDGTAALAIVIRANHHDYCTRRLVHIAHEVFMVFLWDGPYYDYRCEHLGLNPDTGLP